MKLNYFFTRKLSFVKEAHAFALLHGGFGTMDEAFEVLTLMQTGKARIVPVVLLDRPRGRERFVICLNRSLSNEALVDLNNHFTDILRTGEIVQGAAIPKENDEIETLDLPRLIFTPIRSRFGRFRQLIDAINSSPAV